MIEKLKFSGAHKEKAKFWLSLRKMKMYAITGVL